MRHEGLPCPVCLVIFAMCLRLWDYRAEVHGWRRRTNKESQATKSACRANKLSIRLSGKQT
jgi:hypothetical protein